MKEDLFDKFKPNTQNLLSFGFKRQGSGYFYSKQLGDLNFTLNILVDVDGKVETHVIDNETQDEYVLHRVPGAVGEFVGKVRQEYQTSIFEIREKCFEKFIFKTKQSQAIIRYIKEKYGDELEFLWQKFSNNAIWRRKDNKKWYGALMIVPLSKLKKAGNESVEILDIRVNKDLSNSLIDNNAIFEGYHMNKKSWITILINNSISNERIFELIDESYELALK